MFAIAIKFLWANRKWLAYVAVVLAVIMVFLRFSHARYEAGRAAGRAEVQRDWDAARLSAQQAYDDAVMRAAAQQEHDRQVAEEVERGLRESLAAADAGGRSLSQRLREYQASLARCRAVPGPAADSGQPAGTVGSVPGDAELERLSDAAWAACARDGVRLNRIDAWRVKVTP